jgi:DNA-binding CsgD family transcriptional regulator
MPKIEDYALLGDLHTAALVSTAGSINWLCLPRFDSPAAFAALLHNDEAGHWTLASPGASTCTSRRYAGNTLVLETDWVTADGAVRVVDFMPPRADTPHLVRIAVGLDGEVAVRSALRLRFDYGRVVPWVRNLGSQIHAIAGPDRVRMMSAVPVRGDHWDTLADFTVRKGDRVPFVMSWAPGHDPQMPYLDAERAQAEMVLAQPELPHGLREEALTAHLLALAGSHDELAGPLADTILADPSRHDGHTTMAALAARAVIAGDNGQISGAFGLLRDATRHGTAISPDARHPQPLLGLAAALVDLRQLEEAASILHAAEHPVLHDIPAHAGLRILRARIHLANGRADADAAGLAALADAETVGADGNASTAHCVLAVIALRRGDIATAAEHIAGLPAPMPHFPGLYARTETTLAQAQIIEARDGPAAATSHIHQAGAGLPAWHGLLSGDPALAAWLVRTALAAGDQPLANQVTRTAVALADANPGFPALAAAAAHSQGLANCDTGLLAEAAARHPDPWAKASAAEDLAVLLTNIAKDQAIRQLKTALDGYRQTGADRDQARIRRRLRELGVRRRHWTTPATRSVAGWDSLTDTEQAVSRLVAEGLNNNQVAARMYISTHTVAHHLRQAFRKLQIASRVELARIVIGEAAAGS